jgi:hypothetical protein
MWLGPDVLTGPGDVPSPVPAPDLSLSQQQRGPALTGADLTIPYVTHATESRPALRRHMSGRAVPASHDCSDTNALVTTRPTGRSRCAQSKAVDPAPWIRLGWEWMNERREPLWQELGNVSRTARRRAVKRSRRGTRDRPDGPRGAGAIAWGVSPGACGRGCRSTCSSHPGASARSPRSKGRCG